MQYRTPTPYTPREAGNTRFFLYLGACRCLKLRLGARQLSDRPAIAPHGAERDPAIGKKCRQLARRYREVKFRTAIRRDRAETVDAQHASAGIHNWPAAIPRGNRRRMQKRFHRLRRSSGGDRPPRFDGLLWAQHIGFALLQRDIDTRGIANGKNICAIFWRSCENTCRHERARRQLQ